MEVTARPFLEPVALCSCKTGDFLCSPFAIYLADKDMNAVLSFNSMKVRLMNGI